MGWDDKKKPLVLGLVVVQCWYVREVFPSFSGGRRGRCRDPVYNQYIISIYSVYTRYTGYTVYTHVCVYLCVYIYLNGRYLGIYYHVTK